MRVLLFYAAEFWFKTHAKVLVEVDDDFREGRVVDAVVAFVHAAPRDATDLDGVRTKLVKNIKWLAGKFGARAAALHYFAHLDAEAAAPQIARAIIDGAQARLAAVGFAVEVTPFGHFCEWRLSVAGDSLAKVWKEF
ncbi:MAG: threonyl-tRNA synthetase editing domain-containing protein [Planctomycetota bacterium]